MTCFSALKTNRSRLNRIKSTTYLSDPEEARQTWKNHLIVNSETLGLQIWRKKVNYDKLKIVTNSINQIFNPNAFFLPFVRCYMILQCYLHTINIFCFIYRKWR